MLPSDFGATLILAIFLQMTPLTPEETGLVKSKAIKLGWTTALVQDDVVPI